MKQTSIKIEELKDFSSTDAEAIRQLVTKLGSTFQPLTDSDLKSMISSPTTHLLIARERMKNQIIGMGTLAIYRIPYLKKAYLDDFIIDDNYQGQGIGSKLMKTVIEKAKKEGVAYMEFTSNPTRVGANKFYQKMGFEKRETNVYRLTFDHAE